MNSSELNDGTMSLGTQFKWMCKASNQFPLAIAAPNRLVVSLSSVVIFFSLAFAFGGLARTAVGVGCHVAYAYLRYWLGMRKIKVKRFQGNVRLKELQKETDYVLQRREILRRLAEIENTQGQEDLRSQSRRDSWRVMMGRGISGVRSRKATTELDIP
jgi:hypothetical protein